MSTPESTLTSLTLAKFKLTKLGAEAEYTEYEEVEGGIKLATEVRKVYPFQPQPELTEAFDQLVPHLLMLCEIINDETVLEPKDVLELPMSEAFRVTGIVVKETGVTLIGRRRLRGGKVLNLTTPFLLWEVSEGMEEYRFHHSLYQQVDAAENCALAYIGGEYLRQAAHDEQLEINFNQPA